jgi:hypothetical protein
MKFEAGTTHKGRMAHMETGPMLVGVVIALLYAVLWIGGPVFVVDWLRRRRREAVTRQIAITDAIDGRVGAIVSPVVKKPLWGPWQVRIAVPFARPVAAGRILAVVHEVLSVADRMNPGRYEIIITPKQDAVHEARRSRGIQSAKKWSRDSLAAA